MKSRVLALLSISLLIGCGGDPPTADLEAANRAIQDARAAGAEKYASSDLSSAQRAYDAAESELNTEKEKLFKNFEKTNSLIADAKGKAATAESAATSAKAAAKASAESAVADAEAAVLRARTAVDGAPSGKGTEGDVEQLRADLGAADADLSSARSAVAAENYDGARSSASSAAQRAGAIEEGVAAATQKYAEMAEAMRPWYDRM